MSSRRDYTKEAVDAARSVMIELTHLLSAYRDDVVVVGGWVPELLLSQASEPHIGSTDVDLALNHLRLEEAGYRTIEHLLSERGYQHHPRQPFIYYRDVNGIVVEVDLLAGEYDGTGRGHRTQRIQGVRPRKARGCDLAFDGPAEVTLDGSLPGGALDRVTVRVASIVPFITMKGMALADRLNEKDAYDVYYCVRYYPGGVEALAAAFMPHLSHGLVQEGLRNIAAKFVSPGYVGPRHVADFLEVLEAEDREILMRDAYERIAALLERLGVH